MLKEDEKRFFMRALVVILAFFLGFIFYSLLIEPFALNLLKDRIIFDVQKLSLEDVKYLNKMIVLNKIHTGDAAIGSIINFYQTLLTTVIGISTLGGLIGFLYIKNSHKRDICEGIQKEISSEYGRYVIEKEMSRLLNIERESGDLKLQSDNIEELDKRLEEVEKLTNILSENIDEIQNDRVIEERITLPLDGQ